MHFLWTLTVLLLATSSFAKGVYTAKAEELCYGYPKVDSIQHNGVCVGKLVDKSTIPWKKPRKLLFDGEDLYATDMGGWSAGHGKVFKLNLQRQPISYELIYQGLDRVHGIRKGADGFIYLGEATQITKFHPENPGELIAVIDALPESYTDQSGQQSSSSHPLTEFIFLDNKDILVNVGAPSNDCNEEVSRSGACHQRDQQAELRLYTYLEAHNRYDHNYLVVARGLRNSMGLVWNPQTQEIYQAENSADTVGTPDELNIIDLQQRRSGRAYDFGWPFCQSDGQILGGFSIFENFCSSRSDSAFLLLPAHASPLDMMVYRGQMFAEFNNFILMSWHGHRPTGSKIAAYATDSLGRPLAHEPQFLLAGWQKDPQRRHPKGRPVGMEVDSQGAVYVLDDVNATLLVVAKSQSLDDRNDEVQPVPAPVEINFTDQQIQEWTAVYSGSLKALNCASCHSDVLNENPKSSLQNMLRLGWLSPDTQAQKQNLWMRMNGTDGSRIMPPAPARTLIHSEMQEERTRLYHWLYKYLQ